MTLQKVPLTTCCQSWQLLLMIWFQWTRTVVQDMRVMELAGMHGQARAPSQGFHAAAAMGPLVVMAGLEQLFIHRHANAEPEQTSEAVAQLHLEHHSFPEQISCLAIVNAFEAGKVRCLPHDGSLLASPHSHCAGDIST